LFLERRYSGTAYVYMLGSAFFGGIFVWLMIFFTHLMFRRRTARAGQPVKRFGPRGPWTSLFGIVALASVLVSTWWVPGLRITVTAGFPWLLFITLCYFGWRKTHPGDPGAGVTVHG
jgi:amino acid transporter, AAT family